MRYRKGLRALLAASAVAAAALMVPATAHAATAPAQPSVTASGTSAPAGALAPSGYTADGTPIYNLSHIHVRPGTVQPLDAHACVGRPDPDGIVEGVFCADLVDFGTSVQAQAEGACEYTDGSAFVRCSNIDLKFGLYSTTSGLIAGPSEAKCGHNFGLCDVPRFIRHGNTLGPPSGQCWEVWTVVYSTSVIALPVTNHPVSPLANVGSGHVIVCN